MSSLDHHFDHFGIDERRFRSDGFGADLEELPITAFLRPLAPEHRADVIKLLHAGALVETVFDISADNGSRVLGPQRERRAVAVFEGVHFLRNDVGFLPYAAREELRFFEDRGADFVVVVGAENLARDALNAVPYRRVGRQ